MIASFGPSERKDHWTLATFRPKKGDTRVRTTVGLSLTTNYSRRRHLRTHYTIEKKFPTPMITQDLMMLTGFNSTCAVSSTPP
jgi:hypothetical protein